MRSFIQIMFGWLLGIISSVGVFYIQEIFNKHKQLSNILISILALNQDWNDFKDDDNLDRLKFRLNNFSSILDKLGSNFLSLEDKTISLFYINLKRNISWFLKHAEDGNRGLFHYQREDIDKLFQDKYFIELKQRLKFNFFAKVKRKIKAFLSTSQL